MSLYLVVRHPGNPDQRWKNEWRDYSRLTKIETTPEIARLCKLEQRRGARVFIHRTGWREHERRICCSLLVKSVEPGGPRPWTVHFEDERLMEESPPLRVRVGTRWYRARPLSGA